MNTFINKKLLNLLKEHKLNYEKEKEVFLRNYSQDDGEISHVLVEQFEHEHYLSFFDKSRANNFISLLVKQLITYPNDNITNYLTYIDEQYQQFIIGEVVNLKTELEIEYKDLIKKIDIDFANNLLKLNKETEEDKKIFIENFVYENRDKIVSISNYNPELLLKALAKIRNPKLQYEFLNVKNENIDSVKEYIASLDEKNFEKLIYNYFSYPLDMSLEEYHSKWIGKDKIHVKFAKKILNDKYELAKKLLKEESDPLNQYELDDVNNGIRIEDFISVKSPSKEKNKDKEKSKLSTKKNKSAFNKKTNKLNELLKKIYKK